MVYQIHIKDLTLKARVGIHPHEQRMQKVILNLKIFFSGPEDADQDDIQYTLDYEKIIEKIRKLFSQKKFQLLEILSSRVAELVIEDQRVKRVEVSVGKPNILSSQRISVITAKENPDIN